MSRTLKVLVLLAAITLGACATIAGRSIGRGIARASGGDEEAGALIGGGIGMMIDVMD